MCVVIDLDAVCLICLQPNKEMQSVFTTDAGSSELQIAQKISILSELKIDKNNHNLPKKICTKCLQDLKAAWRFRKNCQAAATIFQTIVSLDVEQPEVSTGKEIKVPQGLQIKRMEETTETSAGNSSNTTQTCKNAPIEEYVIVADNDNSTLYEELGSDVYVCRQEDTNEFQSLDDEEGNEDEEENEGDENPLVEYYLNEDGLPEGISIKLESDSASSSKDKQTKIKKEEKDTKQSKLAQFLVKSNKPIKRGRPRKNETQQNDAKQPSQLQTTEKVVCKLKKDEGKSCENNTASQSIQIRQVKTRKRKSLSPITKPPKICEICGNSYRFQHALKSHMRRHYNERPFPCEFCDKAFVSNIELRRHIRVHTGQKPYACQYCDRRFSDFGSRIKHERTHTGERPYACGTCGKSFAYPHVLSVHLLTHTGEKRFRCEYCSKGFTKKVYLISHVEQHHSDLNNCENDEATNSSQEKCDLSTGYANEESVEDNSEYQDDEENLKTRKIIITSSRVQFKEEDSNDEEEDKNANEDNEQGIHEIVEVLPDEYTIRVR